MLNNLIFFFPRAIRMFREPIIHSLNAICLSHSALKILVILRVDFLEAKENKSARVEMRINLLIE